jgi:BirA family biotin operon repressor/biotin-[acetyl-CoA-carboxylase] ligase
VELKWPNDIWLKGKKMGGIILTTTAPNPEKVKYIILGMGLNLNTSKEHFSYEVRDLATSVFLQTGKKVNRPFFFAGLLKELESLYLELQSQGFEKLRKKWHHYAPKMCDHEVKLLNVIAQPGNQQLEVLRGQAKGIDAQGHLRVENEQGQELQILDGELQYQ